MPPCDDGGAGTSDWLEPMGVGVQAVGLHVGATLPALELEAIEELGVVDVDVAARECQVQFRWQSPVVPPVLEGQSAAERPIEARRAAVATLRLQREQANRSLADEEHRLLCCLVLSPATAHLDVRDGRAVEGEADCHRWPVLANADDEAVLVGAAGSFKGTIIGRHRRKGLGGP
jgi:hypothetical protein